MVLTEDRLSASVRAGRLERVYFLYGKEPFLTKMYAERIAKKAAGADPLDFNLVNIKGNPDPDALSDYVEGLPVFADMKAVMVNDPEPEKMDKDTFDRVVDIINTVPDTTVLVFYVTGVETDEKKAKTKKFIEAADKNGAVCRLDEMQISKIAELAVKKAAKAGIVISYNDALYLTERVNGSMTSVSEETAKLMSYVGTGGTITKEIIDTLVAKCLDTGVYELAAAINSGNRQGAFRIIDELFAEQTEPTLIMSALSSAFLDLYYAKLAKANGVNPNMAAEQFGYPKNRAWAFNKAVNAVGRLEIGYLRETVRILSEADIKMKSSPVSNRIIIEQAVTSLFIQQESRR